MIEEEDMPDRAGWFWIYLAGGWALFLIGSVVLFVVAFLLGSIWWIGAPATLAWAVKFWRTAIEKEW